MDASAIQLNTPPKINLGALQGSSENRGILDQWKSEYNQAYAKENLNYENRFKAFGPFQNVIHSWKKNTAFYDFALIKGINAIGGGKFKVGNENGFSGFRLEKPKDYIHSVGATVLAASGYGFVYGGYVFGETSTKVWKNRKHIIHVIKALFTGKRNSESKFLQTIIAKYEGKTILAGALSGAVLGALAPRISLAMSLAIRPLVRNARHNSENNSLSADSKDLIKFFDNFILGMAGGGMTVHILEAAGFTPEKLLDLTIPKASAAGSTDLKLQSANTPTHPKIIDSLAVAKVADAVTATNEVANSSIQTMDYIVQKGDSLNEIAKRFGFSNYKPLIVTNDGIGNPDSLRIGQVLHIPQADPENIWLNPHALISVKVHNGETVNDLANRLGIKPEEIKALNPHFQSATIGHEGEIIVIPNHEFVNTQNATLPIGEVISTPQVQSNLPSHHEIHDTVDQNRQENNIVPSPVVAQEQLAPQIETTAPIQPVQAEVVQPQDFVIPAIALPTMPELGLPEIHIPNPIAGMQEFFSSHPQVPVENTPVPTSNHADDVVAIAETASPLIITPTSPQISLPEWHNPFDHTPAEHPVVETQPSTPIQPIVQPLPEVAPAQPAPMIEAQVQVSLPESPIAAMPAPVPIEPIPNPEILQPNNPLQGFIDLFNPKPHEVIAAPAETSLQPAIETHPSAPAPEHPAYETNVVNGIETITRDDNNLLHSDTPGFWGSHVNHIENQNIPSQISSDIATSYQGSQLEIVPQLGLEDSCFMFAMNNSLANNHSLGIGSYDPGLLAEKILAQVINDPEFKEFVKKFDPTLSETLDLNTPGHISQLSDYAVQFIATQKGGNIKDLGVNVNFNNLSSLGITGLQTQSVEKLTNFFQEKLNAGDAIVLGQKVLITRDGNPSFHAFSIIGMDNSDAIPSLIAIEANGWQERIVPGTNITFLEMLNSGDPKRFQLIELYGYSKYVVGIPLSDKNINEINGIYTFSKN